MAVNRERLTEIIEADGGNNWWKPELFAQKTRMLLPQELEIVTPPPEYASNYNCFAFAFGLHEIPEFLGGQNPVQQEFVKWLVNNNIMTQISNDRIQTIHGNSILYSNKEGVITHIGIMESDDMVISKWMWGPTVRHHIWDVPSSFGDEIAFYKALSPSLVRKKYEEYKATGVVINPIE